MTMNEQNSLAPGDSQTNEHPIGQLPGWLAARNNMGLAIVRCAGLLYGIEVKWVRAIRPFAGATPVYGLPSFWVGVTALRGQLFAILDLQQFLIPQQASAKNWQQVVFTVYNNLSVGLLVEEILEVRQIDAQSITTVSATEAPYVLGATFDQILVLDLAGLFADARLTVQANRAGDAEA